MNLSSVVEFWNNFISLLLPLIAGGILALFASVPINGYKRLLCRIFDKTKLKPSVNTVHFLSFVLTLISIVLVLVIVLTLLIPEIVQSAQNLFEQIKSQIPIWGSTLYKYLDTLEFDAIWLKDLLNEVNIEKVIQQVTGSINFLVPNVTSILTSTVNVVITAIFSIIIAIYIILNQEDISRQSRKVVLAYLKPKLSSRILRFNRLFYLAFTKFLSGQCLEAIILGMLMFIVFSIFGLPYASLIGVLTAICAIVPYIGAFISCAISVLLTALLDPSLAIKCLLVYLVVQFVETQFIYQKVVGNSVNLPAIYILLSALIGGQIFGIVGIIFAIPLVAVVVELIREDVHSKLGESKPKSNILDNNKG
jgi:predicted PurR-regulated permease PerM